MTLNAENNLCDRDGTQDNFWANSHCKSLLTQSYSISLFVFSKCYILPFFSLNTQRAFPANSLIIDFSHRFVPRSRSFRCIDCTDVKRLHEMVRVVFPSLYSLRLDFLDDFRSNKRKLRTIFIRYTGVALHCVQHGSFQ